MNIRDREALDRMASREGLPAILEALAQSYALHLTHSNGRDDIARLEREKYLVSAFADLAKAMVQP